MNRNPKAVFSVLFLVVLVPVLAQTATANPGGKGRQQPGAQASAADIARGQQVFEQNCARCHNPPRNFPPQITGTILRHMRVRASLSAADERALLRFLNQ